MKRLFDGALLGSGFVVVVAVAFAIAWAPARLLSAGGGDILTVDPSERTNLFVRAGKDGTVKFVVSDAGKITVGATESYVNLVIQNDEVAAEADNKVDITADALTVEGIRLENVNVSANIESSGAGGLDTGSELADRWYYVWVITNNNGTSVNGILTLAPLTPNPPTAPVLPSGYTKKRRVGAAKNNAGGNFYRLVQEGNRVVYDEAFGNLRPLFNGQTVNPSWTDVSLAAYVPPTSRRAIIQLGSNFTHNVANVSGGVHARTKGSSASNGTMMANAYSQVVNVFNMARTPGDIGTDDSQVIQYNIDGVPSGGGGCVIDVLTTTTGYKPVGATLPDRTTAFGSPVQERVRESNVDPQTKG